MIVTKENYVDSSQGSGNEQIKTFHHHRVLPYPLLRIFEAFARPEVLARWWGPNGFTNTFEVFEFRSLPASRPLTEGIQSIGLLIEAQVAHAPRTVPLAAHTRICKPL